MKVSGNCLCGAVTVAAEGEPFFMGKCYCSDCQRGSGGGHSTVVALPDGGVAVSGAVTKYVRKGDSGHDVTRAFCPTCGARIYTQAAAMPGVVMLQAGILNDADAVSPGMSIYAASAAPWDQPPAHIPSFPKMPQGPR
jgi:hypothetical protein